MNNRDTLPRVLIAFNPLELATIQAALTHEAERHSLHVIDTTTTHDARRGHRMIATQANQLALRIEQAAKDAWK